MNQARIRNEIKELSRYMKTTEIANICLVSTTTIMKLLEGREIKENTLTKIWEQLGEWIDQIHATHIEAGRK